MKTVKKVEIKQKKTKAGPTLKSPAKGLLKNISQANPGMKYKPVTRRGGK